MKQLILIIAAVMAVSCGNQQLAKPLDTDSTDVSTEAVEQVSSASEADIIDFVASGTYSPIQITEDKPLEIWKYRIDARMEKDGNVCCLKVHSEIWDEGAPKYKSQYTDVYNGHWTMQTSIEGGRFRDWYCYSGINDKGEKFAFRVLTSFNKGYPEFPQYPKEYDISNVEMKKLK